MAHRWLAILSTIGLCATLAFFGILLHRRATGRRHQARSDGDGPSQEASVPSKMGPPLKARRERAGDAPISIWSGTRHEVSRPPLPESVLEVDALLAKAVTERRWQADDAAMSSWPSYADAREKLEQEFAHLIDIDTTPVSGLVETARSFREQFWDVGGTSSISSYKQIFLSRMLLEAAHHREPSDPAVADELVETISSAHPMWTFDSRGDKVLRTDVYVGVLLPLRLTQFKQSKAEITNGRNPTWHDYARACDTAVLLVMAGEVPDAKETVAWVQSAIIDAGVVHPVYGEDLMSVEARFDRGRKFLLDTRFRLYRDTVYATNEELWARRARYQRRRLPAFLGPDVNERGVVPRVEGWTPSQIESFRRDIRYDLTLDD